MAWSRSLAMTDAHRAYLQEPRPVCAFAERWINAACRNAVQINNAEFDQVIFRDYTHIKTKLV